MTTSRVDAAAEVDLAFLLGHASHVLTTELTARLADLGITPRGYCVLAKATPGDRTQIKLADLCGMDKTTMVVTLDELEKSSLVERKLSPTDRRARIIVLTDEGRRVVRQAEEIVAGVYADVLAVLPDDERSAFVSGLIRLVSGRLATPVQCQRAPRRRL
ncbi:MarR family winged helix-turn-helix transcriptional regulator [Actinophytocola xanthii]|uniref:MarR family transcriptional regulator n=1 Tax=Actinophytocola xanthii TaxID=1912961 RepID=A0A1Q8CFY0_9PSEU|nr:MarR family transcriptional regulator [Actinophytocola xanthii]OLF13254.1 MarR family transcriptional regulator [Actinophytocola xanthii]